MNYLKRRGNFILFVMVALLTFAGIVYVAKVILFICTKQTATATVVRVEVNNELPKPYKATMVYQNVFVNDNVVSYVDNIGSNYAKKHIDVHNHLQIYYHKYFPRTIYLIDYKYPDLTNIIFGSVYILVFGTLTYLQFKRRNIYIQKF